MKFFSGGNDVPMVHQSEQSECGLACLAMVGCHFGHAVSLASLRRRLGPSQRGMTLLQIAETATSLDLVPRALKCSARQLRSVSLPAILWWNQDHFVVLKRTTRRGLVINDPAEGELEIGWDLAEQMFSRIALELRPAPGFNPIREGEPRGRWQWLLAEIGALRPSLITLIGLSLSIELLSLGIPLSLQLLIDRVVMAGNLGLHTALVAGLAVLLVAHGSMRLARGWLVSWISATLHAKWTHLFFAKLMGLPIQYFEGRNSADILSRFGSLRTIQTEVSGAAVGSALDGVTSIIVIGVIFGYSPMAALVCIAFLACFVALRRIFLRLEINARHEKLVLDARGENEIIESIRGAKCIKLASQEHVRSSRVLGFACEAARRDLRLQRLSISFDVARDLIAGGGRVAILSLGAFQAAKGEISVGMMMAIVGFSDQFLVRAASFVNALFDVRLLRVDLDRVSEVVTEAAEPIAPGIVAGTRKAPALTLEGVGFRYSERDPWLFRDLSFHFPAGACTAVVAPSGVGKTTLLRIILGLAEPTEGRVLIDGLTPAQYGTRQFREMCAGVFQDDVLFSGTIAENICFFDPDMDLPRVIESARASEMLADIEQLPMGFATRLSELGGGLSGGQRQRILLARALYRTPQLLVLDEATSSLDQGTVQRIDLNVRAMASTRIVVSHNPATVRLADHVLRLGESSLSILSAESAAVASQAREPVRTTESELADAAALR